MAWRRPLVDNGPVSPLFRLRSGCLHPSHLQRLLDIQRLVTVLDDRYAIICASVSADCVRRSGCCVAKSQTHVFGDLIFPVELDDRGQVLSRIDHFVAEEGAWTHRIIIHLALGAAAYLDLLDLCHGALMISIVLGVD